MACGLSKSLGLLSSSLTKQGIVTILGGECDRDISSNTSASSLRRTFSADMSSKSWLSRDGFCPMKTISSSEELNVSVTDSKSFSDEEIEEGGVEESRSGFDIWAQIQEEKKNRKMDEQRPYQSGAWSSILSQKSEPMKMVPPPYVHPIVKRSSSSLSEKSLEICTESLGSETGCDGFSPETEDSQDDEVNKQEEYQKVVVEAKEEDHSEAEPETWVSNYSNNTTSYDKPSHGVSFPPPIPSLSSHPGKSLHMKTSRNNGRLVLEAVSMPSQSNFCAKRQDGRLVLTFTDPKDETDDANETEEEEEEEERNSEVLWFNEEDGEREDTPNGLLGVHISAQNINGLMSVHRLAHGAIGIPKRNPRWPSKGKDEDETAGKPEAPAPVAQSLPPRPRVAQLARAAQPPSTVDDTVGATCFNTYDYYWRPTKPITYTKPSCPSPNTLAQLQAPDSLKNHGWLNGCKEQRRSLLFFESFCITTS